MTYKIATPLTEQTYGERQFYEPLARFTPDGLFMIVHKPLKQIRFLAANNAEAIMKFKDKPR